MPSFRELVTGRLLVAETGREGDRVTTLELFFDLVYVFAFTQVTHHMATGHDAIAVLEGLVVLALVWWSWTSFAWLSNQAHADRGIVRTGVMIALTSMFVVSLTVPEAFSDLPGGLHAPIVFVVAYLVVRATHMTVYVIAAGDDAGLRRQVLVSMLSAATPASVLLVIGALVGEPAQVWIWAAAMVLDLIVVYVTSKGGDWRIFSAAHWAERHGLVVIVALGESIVAIGVGAAELPVSVGIIAGAVLAVGLSIALWWNYFHHLSTAAEHRLARMAGQQRAQAASDGYTYLHLAIVAGIVLTALGVEQVMHHIDPPAGEAAHGTEPLGLFAAAALAGGVACYIAATAFFWRRMSGEWSLLRFGTATLLVAAVPLLALLAPLAALAVVAALAVGLCITEQALGSRGKLRTAAPDAAGAGAPA